jgi:formate hydrogenlyase subunit 5
VRAETRRVDIGADALAGAVADAVAAGARFAGLFATARESATELVAVLAPHGRLEELRAVVPATDGGYPAITPSVPAAAWYEREIHDLFGIVPRGHRRLNPLVLPLAEPTRVRPRPGSRADVPPLEPDESALGAHVMGEGMFTIPYGPVRSGVFESIEYLVETAGEEIPHLRTRVFYKHRGLERRFEDLDPADGVLLAERVEGVAGVAHAIAYCGALERIGAVSVPLSARLVRSIHAELERVANHLDVALRLTEAAGLAVATARFGLHKERMLRLVGRLCGNRFGRGVVLPGGARGWPGLGPAQVRDEVGALEGDIRRDVRLLMDTPSFLDRVRTTGPLAPDAARAWGALGPVGRGSGVVEDVRIARPYAAYDHLGFEPGRMRSEGDALARLHVRWEEVWGSFHLVRQAVDELTECDTTVWRVPLPGLEGEAIGWAEAPQGEVLYLVEVSDGRLVRVKPRSASFHNLALLPQVFQGDILTDFAFIEASFGLSIAGVAG